MSLVAIASFAPDAKQIGSGLLLIVIGLSFMVCGGKAERRFTTWTAALAAGLGAVLVVTKLLENSDGTASGFWLMVLGVLLRAALDEPDDIARAQGIPHPTRPGTIR